MRAPRKALFITLILLVAILQSPLAIVPQVQASPGGMEQVIFGGYVLGVSPNIAYYNTLFGGYSWTFSEVLAHSIVSPDGVIKSLRVRLSAAPGVGKKYAFTVILNGNPTALTFDIADLDTSGSNVVDEVVVTGGDIVYLECDPSGIPTAVLVYWTSVFEGDVGSESLIMGGGISSLNNLVTEFGQVMGPETHYSITENDFRQVVPTSGKIKDFYVLLSTDPGTAPDAYRFTLRKGPAGGPQADTLLTVTITADDIAGSDLVNAVDVVAGDVLTMMIEPLNTPSVTPRAAWGMTFEADVDGESIVLGGSNWDLDDTLTEYNHLTSYEGSGWWTEAKRYQLGQNCTLKKLHILLSGSPGAGSKYEFTLRIAEADSNLVATVSDASITGNSGALEDTVADDDYVVLQVVPTDTPTVRDAYWGFVCYITPPPMSYTEKISTFAIAADGVWTDYDLHSLQDVPKGDIAEIVCTNKNGDFARMAGVRTDGSALNRYIDIHEAEGGGVITATMFVKCHETTGLIECYSEIQGDVDFYLLGAFGGDVDFTEAFTNLGQPGLAWADLDLTASGVPDDSVVQILMGNEANAADYFAGVRADGSALERGVTLDEAEGGSKRALSGSWTTLSMVVQSSSAAVIEWKGGSVTDVTMWLLGWFNSGVSFTEGFTDYSPAANSMWESKTIAEAAAGSVAAFALVHQDSGAETFCGLREDGSALARMIEEHEAEGGSSTGFQACIFLDVNKCEVYCEDANEAQFYYTGCFTIIVAPVKPNIPFLVIITFNTTIAEKLCGIYAKFFDTEGLDGYIFWNNATSAPGGVNSTFTGLAGVSDSTQEDVTLPSSGTKIGVKYYVNDTDGNWGADNLVMFPTAALDVPQVNYPYVVSMTLNSTDYGNVTKITGVFNDEEGLSGRIFWNNATNPPVGINGSWIALGGASSAMDTITMPNATVVVGLGYYVNDTDGNWAYEPIFVFPASSAPVGNGVTYLTGSIGIFLICFIILLPIIFYAVKKR